MSKLVIKLVTASMVVLGLVACATTTKSVPNLSDVPTTEQFQITDLTVSVEQFVTPDIVYHSDSEIEQQVFTSLKSQLNDSGLYSDNSAMTALDIHVTYHRRFVGDKTPLPSDSLAYPSFDYVIKVMQGDTVLTTITRKNLTYSGGLSMNLQAASGLLRKKENELPFFNGLATSLTDTVKALKN